MNCATSQTLSEVRPHTPTPALATGATMLTGGDLGCLMNIAGRAKRLGVEIEVRHIAELLAGDIAGPSIGEGESQS